VVSMIREIVLIRVDSAQPVDSPAYDLGMTEDQVRERWERHFESLRAAGSGPGRGDLYDA